MASLPDRMPGLLKIWTPTTHPCHPNASLQTASDPRASRNRFARNPLAKVGSLFVPKPLRFAGGYPCCCERNILIHWNNTDNGVQISYLDLQSILEDNGFTVTVNEGTPNIDEYSFIFWVGGPNSQPAWWNSLATWTGIRLIMDCGFEGSDSQIYLDTLFSTTGIHTHSSGGKTNQVFVDKDTSNALTSGQADVKMWFATKVSGGVSLYTIPAPNNNTCIAANTPNDFEYVLIGDDNVFWNRTSGDELDYSEQFVINLITAGHVS